MLFSTPEEFSTYIELEAKRNNKSLIQTLVEFEEANDFGDEMLRKMIHPSLKGKLEEEFTQLGYIKSTSFSIL